MKNYFTPSIRFIFIFLFLLMTSPLLLAQETYGHLDNYPTVNKDGSINIIIEIPAGTNEKWEYSTKEKKMELEHKNGKPRIVQYLGYPGNYGMVLHTLLSKETGGDGDPLDVLALGLPLPRETITKAKLIGVLKFLDNGEQDDKLIAVLPSSPLYTVKDLFELEKEFPGVISIIKIWFSNYKGSNKMVFQGQGSLQEAEQILHAAIAEY
jgi:inorganic pyrophosphatase